ncbi:MAG: ABC transporter ATP-binding protein [Elusimicrobiota bacterium]
MDILKFASVTTGYDGTKVIDGVSFTIPEGSITGIIGPNGAGKTTVVRLATKILSPWSGDVYLNDKNLRSIPVAVLAKTVAVLPQVFSVPFGYTVYDFVLMGRYPWLSRLEAAGERDRVIVEQSLQFADVHNLREREVNTLSGGERQRVLLAQALAQKPQVLLLDEPTTFLDISHQVEILDKVKLLNSEKKVTILMVIHDLNLASEYCDSIVLLNKGKVEIIGTPAEVLKYEIIEHVYNTVVVVRENPLSKKPVVFTVPKHVLAVPKTL